MLLFFNPEVPSSKNGVCTLVDQNNSQNPVPKVIVIFPAKNEEGTIENSIATVVAKQSHQTNDDTLLLMP